MAIWYNGLVVFEQKQRQTVIDLRQEQGRIGYCRGLYNTSLLFRLDERRRVGGVETGGKNVVQ